MKKDTIVMLSVPHSGTHTWYYLLRHVGKLPLWWGHLEPKGRVYIDRLLQSPQARRTIFAFVYRSRPAVIDSHVARAEDKCEDHRAFVRAARVKEAKKYAEECLEIYQQYAERLDPIILVTEGSLPLRMGSAHTVFRALNAPFTQEVKDFVTEWPRINARGETGFGAGMQKEFSKRHINFIEYAGV